MKASRPSMVYFKPLVGYFLGVLTSVGLALSATSFLFQWVCLEIGVLAVLPILSGAGGSESASVSFKYFISQSTASVLFLLGSIAQPMIPWSAAISFLALLFKMGLPPFHSWVLGLISTLGFVEMFLLFTIQKAIPLMILSGGWVGVGGVWLVCLSCFLCSLYFMISISSVRMMLFLSSFANGLWLVIGASQGGAWEFYLIGYTSMMALLMGVLASNKLNKSLDLLGRGGASAATIGLLFFSLAGVPPFLGFMMKLVLLQSVADLSMAVSLIMVFTSMFVLMSYSSVFISAYCLLPKGGGAGTGLEAVAAGLALMISLFGALVGLV